MNKIIIFIFALTVFSYGCGKKTKEEIIHNTNDEKESVISEQAIVNMGIVVEEVDSSDFTVYEPVPAVVTETSFNELPLFSPFAGRVKDIKVKLGCYVSKGDCIIQIIRDPISKVTLTLTEDILTTAAQNLYTNRYIDGDDEDEKNEESLLVKDLWKQALKQNGIWNNDTKELFASLPESAKSNQWAVATIGELAAEGLLKKEVLAWFQNNKAAGKYIIEIGGLLQEGYSLENLQDLYEMGAFEAIINIKAPASSTEWDVENIHVKHGERVEAGATLVTLTNHSKMYLIAKPVGSEISIINSTASNNASIKANPLVPGAAEVLEGLKITKILGRDNDGTHVYLPVTNKISSRSEQNGSKYRNWMLRNGMKFILQIPVKKLKDVIVLPSEAVIDNGVDKVIFVKEGKDFIKRKVVVLFQDEEVVVLGEGSEVFPEEPMVTRGAFALNMALLADGPQKIDAHANCDHGH